MAQNTENPRASEARPTQQYATNMQGESPPTEDGYFRQVGRLTRQAIAKNPKADRAYRTTVRVVGGGGTALGVVMVPLAGPRCARGHRRALHFGNRVQDPSQSAGREHQGAQSRNREGQGTEREAEGCIHRPGKLAVVR